MRIFRVRLIFATIAVLFAAQSHWANAATSPRGANTFHANCEMCHGETGEGSAMGKSLQAPDLRSSQVQSQSDAELARFIGEGKGAMPSFKASLSHQQILDEVHYVRHLKEHEAAK